jgi:hypothetical protein
MSKKIESKLDAFAERLDAWFTPKEKGGDGLTLAEAREQLALDGCSVSPSTLSRWWQTRQRETNQKELLGEIVTSSNQCASVEKEFAKNPAPELETIIKLHRVLIFNLRTAGRENPDMIKLADQCTRTVMDYLSGQTKAGQKERELSLSEKKFEEFKSKAAAARTELAKLRDPKAALSDADRLSIVDKVDEVLGIK